MPQLGMAFVHLMFALAALSVHADWRNITKGYEIPDEGYCDQPYVVVMPDGSWLCTMTTGPGEEGNVQQHVVATISNDKGKTWTPLIDIEPHGPPEASWVMPLLVPSGRVYAFYVYNGDNLREVLMSNGKTTKRVDTLGHYVFKYSDDGGRTWSPEQYRIPIREFDIDTQNAYGGAVQFFWGVGKPVVVGDTAYIGLAKVGAFGTGFLERTEGFFLRSDNVLTETDPAKIRWETLPAGTVGLRAPAGPIAEEHNLTWLDNGSLYCTYRTVDGHPCHAYSSDGGMTWTGPEYMTYEPGGRRFKHPRAANFVRRFSNGKYLYWFHNHGGRSYDGRNPVWLCGGMEVNGRLHWSQPEIVLYDDDPKTRMSYPDFIEDDGRLFVTETQKTVARVHEIPPGFLGRLWSQMDKSEPVRDGLAVEASAEACGPGAVLGRLPASIEFSVELIFATNALPAGSLITAGDAQAPILEVEAIETGALRLTLRHGDSNSHYESDPGVLSTANAHHVSIIVDSGPRIVLFVVDGVLCDGGAVRPSGWYRLDPAFQDFGEDVVLVSGASFAGELHTVRVYNRALHVSEAVLNWRAASAPPKSSPK